MGYPVLWKFIGLEPELRLLLAGMAGSARLLYTPSSGAYDGYLGVGRCGLLGDALQLAASRDDRGEQDEVMRHAIRAACR